MTEIQRPKRVAQLQIELARLKNRHDDLANALKLTRKRMDEVEAVLEQLGAPEPAAELGPFFGEEKAAPTDAAERVWS